MTKRFLFPLLVIATAVALLIESPATAQEEPGTITGVVFHDLDGDGVRDEGEPGLANRNVDLAQGGVGLRTVTAGQDGAYVFEGIMPGDYTVHATLDQHQGGCVDTVFTFYPLGGSFCVIAPLPWKATTPDSIAVVLDSAATIQVDFGAEPADVAVVAGRAVLEDDRARPGTLIEALVNGQQCGTTTALTEDRELDFVLNVLGEGERAGCARRGDLVQFRVGGVPAAETLSWAPFTDVRTFLQLKYQDLVAMQQHAWYWYQTSFEFLGEEPPAAGTPVQAVIGGVVCGEATILRSPDGRLAGFSRLIVPSAELQAGCGHAGESVSFLFDGVATGEPIEWRPGLQYINPLAGPVVLPSTGGGQRGATSLAWPGILAAAGAASVMLVAGRLLAAGRR